MPVSPAKLAANRLNARKSTGPRTPRGKAIAAANALKHGRFARHLLLSGECSDELTQLKTAMVRRLNPRDELELELVDRIVAAAWKLRRLQRYEALLYQRECQEWDDNGFNDREFSGLGPREPVPADIAWKDSSAEFKAELDRLAVQERQLDTTMRRTLRQLALLQKTDIHEPMTEFAAEVVATEQTASEIWQNEATAIDTLKDHADLTDARQRRINRVEDREFAARTSLEKAENKAKRQARRAAERPYSNRPCFRDEDTIEESDPQPLQNVENEATADRSRSEDTGIETNNGSAADRLIDDPRKAA